MRERGCRKMHSPSVMVRNGVLSKEARECEVSFQKRLFFWL